MPSPEVVLNGLTAIANAWRPMAIGWHLVFAAVIGAMFLGWRPTKRLTGMLLLLPLATVSGLAWATGNPFNGVAFAMLVLTLAVPAGRMAREPVSIGPPSLMLPGAMLMTFGWIYPHFLLTGSWISYVYAAPLGVVPCATLSALIGATLILDIVESRAWSAALAAAGVLYGAVGVFRLGVSINVVLLGGALLLAGVIVWDRSRAGVIRIIGEQQTLNATVVVAEIEPCV